MTVTEKTYKEIEVGDSAEFSITITQKLIEQFTEVSGDINPLHVDPVYAATTTFGKPIAHGMIAGALCSRLIGTLLPGKYALYLSQKLDFHKPIHSGDEVMIQGKVRQKVDAFQAIIIDITVHVNEEMVVSGEAVVKVLL